MTSRIIAGILTACVVISDVPSRNFDPSGIAFWLTLTLILVLAFIGSFGGKAIEEYIKNYRSCHGNGKKIRLRD